MTSRRTRKQLFWIALLLASAVLGGSVVLFGLNSYIKSAVAEKIISPEEALALNGVDCILVLGCGVWDGGIPTPMLADRLTRGIALYEGGASGKMLMSGDHGREEYDEVNVMKQYAISAGIPSENVFMDHAGFSTYESLYRAKAIFRAERIIVVTQGYHLYRALYIAEGLGLEAYGVGADERIYAGQPFRELRELLARGKDFFAVIFQPEPAFLGETIPVSGDGNLTND